MRAIDNIHHAVASALSERIDLSRLVVTAWEPSEVAKLGSQTVRALGIDKPEVELDDVIPGALIGTLPNLALAHSKGPKLLADLEDIRRCYGEYVALIARVCDTKSERFLRQARHEIHEAIDLSIAARFDLTTLEDRYRRTPPAAAFSFVVEVAQYYRDFKQQCGLVDVADVLAGEFEPIHGCKLCLIDRGNVPLLGMTALRRLLPNAYVCTVTSEGR